MITPEVEAMVADQPAMEQDFFLYILEDIPARCLIGGQGILGNVPDSFRDEFLMMDSILEQLHSLLSH